MSPAFSTSTPAGRAMVFLCGLMFAVMSSHAAEQTRRLRSDAGNAPVRSILWVGNSFFYCNNSMHGHYNELAYTADRDGKDRG